MGDAIVQITGFWTFSCAKTHIKSVFFFFLGRTDEIRLPGRDYSVYDVVSIVDITKYKNRLDLSPLPKLAQTRPFFYPLGGPSFTIILVQKIPDLKI